MSVDGVWTGEIYGPYGWENSGVYVLEHGLVMGGNNRHYSIGKYSVSGNTYKAEVDVHYYGSPRAIFGEKRENFRIEVVGELGKDAINGRVIRSDTPQFLVDYRMTRRMGLPAT